MVANIAPKSYRGIPLVAFIMVLLSASMDVTGQEKMTDPESKTVDKVDEDFGVKVTNPYQWLENDGRESDEVRD